MQSGTHIHAHAREWGDGRMGRGMEMRERFQMNKIRVLRRLLTCMRSTHTNSAHAAALNFDERRIYCILNDYFI